MDQLCFCNVLKKKKQKQSAQVSVGCVCVWGGGGGGGRKSVYSTKTRYFQYKTERLRLSEMYILQIAHVTDCKARMTI